MLLFSFPAHSFEELANLKKLIRDWGHTTEDWLEYILEWRDRILEYEEQNLLDGRWSNQGPVYEHFWHGQQWKIPKKYEQQSEDLALIIGEKGQAILDVFGVMEVWVKRKPNTKYPSNLKIKRMFQTAKHLAFLMQGEINKEWRRLEESEKPIRIQPPEKKSNLKKNRSKKVLGKNLGSDLLMISALTKHHEYENGSCKSFEPLGCSALAEELGLAKSTASEFFKRRFKDHAGYKILCISRNISTLLKILNLEVSPHNLFGGGASKIQARDTTDL